MGVQNIAVFPPQIHIQLSLFLQHILFAWSQNIPHKYFVYKYSTNIPNLIGDPKFQKIFLDNHTETINN